MNYFSIQPKSENIDFYIHPINKDLDINSILKDNGQLDNISIDFKFNKSIDKPSEVWIDYLPNNFSWPVFSEKIKFTIDSFVENLKWMELNVCMGEEKKKYFVPILKSDYNILDKNKTLFVNGTDQIIKAVFSVDSIFDEHIFRTPSKSRIISSDIYLSNKVIGMLKKKDLIGVKFKKLTRIS